MEAIQHWFMRYFVNNGAYEWWLTGLKTTLLVTLLALRNLSLWDPAEAGSDSATATVSQFRDFVSGCVGFLIGSPPGRDGPGR